MGLTQSIEEIEKSVEQLKKRVQCFNGKLSSSEFYKLQKDLNKTHLNVIKFSKRSKSELNGRCNQLLFELNEELKLLSEKVSLEDYEQNEETLPEIIKNDSNTLINKTDVKINKLGNNINLIMQTRSKRQRVSVEDLIKLFTAELLTIMVEPESELDFKKKCLLQELELFQERLLTLNTTSTTISDFGSIGDSSMDNQSEKVQDQNTLGGLFFPSKPSSSATNLSTHFSSNYQNPMLELNKQLPRKSKSVEAISSPMLQENDKVHLTGSTENMQDYKQKTVTLPVPFQPLNSKHEAQFQKHSNPPIVAPPNYCKSTREAMLNNDADEEDNIKISVPVLVVKNKPPNYNDVSKEVQNTNLIKNENIKPPVVYQSRNENLEIRKQSNNTSVAETGATHLSVTIDERAISNKQTDKIQSIVSLDGNNPESENVKKFGFPSSWFIKKKRNQSQNTDSSKSKDESIMVYPPMGLKYTNDNCYNTKTLIANDDETKSEDTGYKDEKNKICISKPDSNQKDYYKAINYAIKNKQYSLLPISKTYVIK